MDNLRFWADVPADMADGEACCCGCCVEAGRPEGLLPVLLRCACCVPLPARAKLGEIGEVTVVEEGPGLERTGMFVKSKLKSAGVICQPWEVHVIVAFGEWSIGAMEV